MPSKPHILPETGFIRLPLVLSLIPVAKSSWWEGIKEGRFPKPVKLGPRTTAWRVEDIRALIEHLGHLALDDVNGGAKPMKPPDAEIPRSSRGDAGAVGRIWPTTNETRN
jgi:predicted DNA-binding transcriptional regulator AlpA